jgi:hypothetical protein
MFGRSWRMHGRRRSRSPRRSRAPHRTRSPRQNPITRAGVHVDQDEVTRTFSEDMPSSTSAVTTDEEADGSLSSAWSPSTASSTVRRRTIPVLPQPMSPILTAYSPLTGPGAVKILDHLGSISHLEFPRYTDSASANSNQDTINCPPHSSQSHP